jgi:exodeoxyribonuclease-1
VAFVFYDVETTGRHRHFDQILQFAAIKTDDDFIEIDRFDSACRLQPHIVPAPRALAVNGLRIDEITHGGRKSYYAMVSEIHQRLSSWGPAIYLGYNSIKFDEEFLRNAFYQCLFPPYVTNTRPNIRGDVLPLVRSFSVLHADKLNIPVGPEQRPSFALAALAVANGFPNFNAHEAMADVQATVHLCSLVAREAPVLWSQFQRFTQRASAVSFMEDEDAFLLCDSSSRRGSYCVALAGRNRNPKASHIYYCINLDIDVMPLRAFSDEQLDAAIAERPDILHRVKVNAAPILYALSDTPEHLNGGVAEDTWYERGRHIKENPAFLERLVAAGERTERQFPPGTYVEELLYEGSFWPDSDAALMAQFHRVPWEDRTAIASRFTDKRLQQLSRRLIYLERSDVLPECERLAMANKMQDRIFGRGAENPPWTTVAQALEEVAIELMNASGSARKKLEEYRQFLARL